MDFDSLVEGPLLWIACIALITAILTRIGFFLLSISRGKNDTHSGWSYIVTTLGRSFLPFHSAVTKRPLYAVLRYIFHLCLIVVPIWFSGHIFLWEESRLGWSWRALPDAWIDWMTLVVLGLSAYFLIRHFILRDVRLDSSPWDYLLIVMIALSFMTGYFLTHGTLESIPLFGDNMLTIHMLSGEAILAFAAFLFCRTRLNDERCTGCAACALSCPTGTIEANDEGTLRIFSYSHYQCIVCGECVNACPEEAAELRHEMGIGNLFRVFSRERIRTAELTICEKCGALFAPTPQVEKIGQTISDQYINRCPSCKVTNLVDHSLNWLPGPRGSEKPS
jgi:Pyruvate/2-oxoacid:ferredoxin oxidoreductase delta subunit